MGYQPKYAAKGRKPQKAPPPQKPQNSKKPSVLFILLSIVIVPVSLYLTWNLLSGMLESFGRPKPVTQQKTLDMAIEEQVDAYVRERMESARGALLSQERPEEAPTETIPPVRKVYWIDEDAQVAPEPDQSLFGQTDDPASLQDILDRAAYLLDGQQLYFHTDVELFQNTPVRYYLDDSIFAITWKEVHEGSVYTFSEVKVSHPSQFRLSLIHISEPTRPG